VADSLWVAIALLLILEGLLPFLAPRLWREAFARLTLLTDGQLRFIGLVAIGFGIVSLIVLQHA
jgi:uncharacterized protein YjeT (DUF2065 family)